MVLMRQDRLAEAEEHHRIATAMGKQIWGTDHPRMVQRWSALALLLTKRRKYEEAERLYEQVIDLARRVETGGFVLLSNQNNLALLYQRQGRYAEAAEMYRKVLTKKRAIVGHDRHPSIVVTLFNLSSVLHENGLFAEAESYLRRVVELDRELLGDTHKEVGVDLTALATLLRDRGTLQEATARFEEARPLIESNFDPEHRRWAEWALGQGSLLVLRERPTEAEPLLRKALAAYDAGASGATWRRPAVQGWLGRALIQQGDVADGRRLLETAHRDLDALLGSDHWRTRRFEQMVDRAPAVPGA
jgi:tetratricopeptide (TPR) repeat protein